MPYISAKTYGAEVGLSCAFRQWRAESHCHFIHGYALSVRVEFEADTLDDRNWVGDFGGLKGFKRMLEQAFDHKLVVASDDPHIELLRQLDSIGLAQIVEMPAVGCEAFAEAVFLMAYSWLNTERPSVANRVRVKSAEVREHGANSACFTGHK
jgi:6-pyruvoyltetrahydropterin/6-carboxytetrahydropterin synthase